MNELLRNGSGYVDSTAYKAIKNLEGVKDMEFKRGEIYEYERNNEIKKALIVSADYRAGGRYLNIIVLMDEAKGEYAPIMTQGGLMYADCGMVSFATNDRLGEYLRTATDSEMNQVDKKIARCLGIEQLTLTSKEVAEPVVQCFEEVTQARTEAKIYKDLYENLLAKVMK